MDNKGISLETVKDRLKAATGINYTVTEEEDSSVLKAVHLSLMPGNHYLSDLDCLNVLEAINGLFPDGKIKVMVSGRERPGSLQETAKANGKVNLLNNLTLISPNEYLGEDLENVLVFLPGTHPFERLSDRERLKGKIIISLKMIHGIDSERNGIMNLSEQQKEERIQRLFERHNEIIMLNRIGRHQIDKMLEGIKNGVHPKEGVGPMMNALNEIKGRLDKEKYMDMQAEKVGSFRPMMGTLREQIAQVAEDFEVIEVDTFLDNPSLADFYVFYKLLDLFLPAEFEEVPEKISEERQKAVIEDMALLYWQAQDFYSDLESKKTERRELNRMFDFETKGLAEIMTECVREKEEKDEVEAITNELLKRAKEDAEELRSLPKAQFSEKIKGYLIDIVLNASSDYPNFVKMGRLYKRYMKQLMELRDVMEGELES